MNTKKKRIQNKQTTKKWYYLNVHSLQYVWLNFILYKHKFLLVRLFQLNNI